MQVMRWLSIFRIIRISENVPMFCEQLYDLALISHEQLAPEAMTKFIERSNKIMMLLADK